MTVTTPRQIEPSNPASEFLDSSNWHLGSTYAAWSLRSTASHVRIDCSYGVNIWAQSVPESEDDTRFWQTVPAKGAGNIPLLTDSVFWWACQRQQSIGDPPEFKDAWTDNSLPCCMNRHNGFISAVFMDWSSRKVGVKELWTLKWHSEFDIAGSWTRTGGVQTGNWPQWMNSFKEY